MKIKALAAVAALAIMLTGCGAAAEAVKPPKPLPLLVGLTVPAPTATAKPAATTAPVIVKGRDIHQPVTEWVDALPAAPKPVAKPQPAAKPKQEDDPGWDCYKDGDLICGPTAPTQQAEAWNNFDTAGFTETELAKPFKVTYRGTARQGSILADGHEWYLAPSSTKGFDHVFEIQFGVTK